eukprot:1626144-Amphidinium_carterae.1
MQATKRRSNVCRGNQGADSGLCSLGLARTASSTARPGTAIRLHAHGSQHVSKGLWRLRTFLFELAQACVQEVILIVTQSN